MKKNEIAKGLRVRAKGYVESGYFWRVPLDESPDKWSIVCSPGESQNARLLARRAKPFEGVVVGTSHRVTGLNIHGDGKWGGKLASEKRHFVVMVQPTHTLKYQKPKAVLLEDLEIPASHNFPDDERGRAVRLCFELLTSKRD